MAPARHVSSAVSFLGLTLLALSAVSVSGCAALSYVFPLYGEITNASNPACASSLATETKAALQKQGETPEDSTGAANRAARSIARLREPTQFEAASSSVISYWFNFEPRHSGCLLKLFEIHKGGAVKTNTITYYAKRPLTGCTCGWAYVHESSYP
jgi:hypothetical protein